MKTALKFKHTFVVDGEDIKILVKFETNDCWPGGVVTNYPDIQERLGRPIGEEESVSICRGIQKVSHKYAVSLYKKEGSRV